MSYRPPPPNRSQSPGRTDRGRFPGSQPEQEGSDVLRYAVIFLAPPVLAILCVASILVYRLVGPNSSGPFLTDTGLGLDPTALSLFARSTGQAQLLLEPDQGYFGHLVEVSGRGWLPGEPVFVFLRSPGDGENAGYSYAAAVADDDGAFRTAFTFPNEIRWIGQDWAEVVARGTRSGTEAGARFTLVAPTPTATLPPPPATLTIPATEMPVPTNTPIPIPTATALVTTDWRAEFFTNRDLAGDPVLVRNDLAIDFFWGQGSPAPGLPTDRFSVRWSRGQYFSEGPYRFTVAADDGVRFWIDGQIYVDEWHDGPVTPYTVDLYVPEGEHALLLEYYENLGDAAVHLSWTEIEPPTATPTTTPTATPTATPTRTQTPTVRPSDTPSPTPTPTTTPTPTDIPQDTPWDAEYFGNPNLAGEPVLVRKDEELNFDWGTGSPGDPVPVDLFSARWVRGIRLPTGNYRFSLDVDDGVRFWIDGLLIIDEWHAGSETYSAEAFVPEGHHRLLVEYYEETDEARVRFWAELLPSLATDTP